MSNASDKPIPAPLPWSAGQLLLAFALVGAAVASMRSAWNDWAMQSWHQEEHSHVFLVIPFAAAIMYVNRDRFVRMRGGVSWAGPLIVALGAGLAWEGFNHAHQSFWHAGAVLMAVGAGITILGHDLMLKFWPAFLLLGFMVPMPNTLRLKIAFPLQTAMAQIVERIFAVFGEPVGRQGNSITYNGKEVLIVEACNGLRGVFTLILVTWLFAFIVPLKSWVRWALILLSPLVALLCNIVRLIPTLLLYGYASDSVAEKFHDLAGWLMVFLAFFMLIFVMKFIEALGFELRSDSKQAAEAPAESEKVATVNG